MRLQTLVTWGLCGWTALSCWAATAQAQVQAQNHTAAQTVPRAAPAPAQPQVAESVRLGLGAGQPLEALVLLDDAAVAAAEQLRFGAIDQAVVGGPGTAVASDWAARMQFREARYDSLKNDLLTAAGGADLQVLTRYAVLPVMHLRLASPAALARLVSHPLVRSVDEVRTFTTSLSESLALIRQPQAAAAGRTGAGTTVAVLDTGVDYARSAFGSCAAPGGSCKVAVAIDFATEDGQRDADGHGTNVAGIVLGVAPGARIAALDVFNGAGAPGSALLGAINWVIAQRANYNIAAVNMSLGGGSYTSPLAPTDSFGTALQALVNAGVVVVVASGNERTLNAISSPAAYSNVVSVGAVYDSNVGAVNTSVCSDATTAADRVACFSNSASFLTLLAPGARISAAGYTMGGTSQAAPHVAGAAAVLRAAFPTASTAALITRLSTGPAVTDHRNGIVKPRLDLVSALGSAAPGLNLSVGRNGTGTGTVTSNPAGVACGSDCSELYASGTVVTLSATAAAGSVFAGWSGACTGTAATCSVTMSVARSVTATFNTAPPVQLTVGKAGTGSGMVASSPAGINCGADCTEPYPVGTSVTLTATPANGSVFAGWSGACTGTASTCTVAMSAARSVTASFTAVPPVMLTVAKTGSGAGTVSSSPAGISCGSDCSELYVAGSSVVLTATAASGSVFSGWSGACAGTASTCTVPMTAARSVTASFNPPSQTLSVLRLGAGTVTSSPAGISCGTVCTASLAGGTSVTLTATAASGWQFQRWSGACSGTATTCTVSLSQARSVTATFAGAAQAAIGSAVEAPSLAWSGLPASGSTAWAVVNMGDAVGGSAARSGVIGHNGVTTLRTVVTGPGLLQFRWRVSSEAGYDWLSFSFNGWEQLSISGESGWREASWLLPAGTHTLAWTYLKDLSDVAGSDAGFVDHLRFTAMATSATASTASAADQAGLPSPERRRDSTARAPAVGLDTEHQVFGPVLPK